MSEKECEKILSQIEEFSVEDASLGNGKIRNNTKVTYSDENLASKVFNVVIPFLPPTVDDRHPTVVRKKMRLYRYLTGGYFTEHTDGGHRFGTEGSEFFGHVSEWTFVIYLNTVKSGGQTRFFRLGPDQQQVDVDACAGRLVVFTQRNTWHSGVEVEDGIKLILQGHIMFGPTDRLPPIINTKRQADDGSIEARERNRPTTDVPQSTRCASSGCRKWCVSGESVCASHREAQTNDGDTETDTATDTETVPCGGALASND